MHSCMSIFRAAAALTAVAQITITNPIVARAHCSGGHGKLISISTKLVIW